MALDISRGSAVMVACSKPSARPLANSASSSRQTGSNSQPTDRLKSGRDQPCAPRTNASHASARVPTSDLVAGWGLDIVAIQGRGLDTFDLVTTTLTTGETTVVHQATSVVKPAGWTRDGRIVWIDVQSSISTMPTDGQVVSFLGDDALIFGKAAHLDLESAGATGRIRYPARSSGETLASERMSTMQAPTVHDFSSTAWCRRRNQYGDHRRLGSLTVSLPIGHSASRPYNRPVPATYVTQPGCASRPVRSHWSPRGWRDGRGVQGARYTPRPHRRHQGAPRAVRG